MIPLLKKVRIPTKRFFFLLLSCSVFLGIDLLTFTHPLIPYFSHGALFYLVLYKSRSSWIPYALILGIFTDLTQFLPIGTYSLNIFLVISIASHARLTLKSETFPPIWLRFGLVELTAWGATLILSFLIFHQTAPHGHLIKHALTWSLFPVQFYFLTKRNA